MGHRQEIQVSKYTQKNYCTISCLNLNDISFFTINHFIMMGNLGVYKSETL